MATGRVDGGVSGNREASASAELVSRLKEVLGDESVSSFSRRCGFRESVFRGYLVEGKKPGLEYLVAIADAGGVTIDWLATGRLPRTRQELRAALQESPAQAPAGINIAALQTIIEGTLKVAPNASASAQAAHCAKVYKELLETGMITAGGANPGDPEGAG